MKIKTTFFDAIGIMHNAILYPRTITDSAELEGLAVKLSALTGESTGSIIERARKIAQTRVERNFDTMCDLINQWTREAARGQSEKAQKVTQSCDH